MIDKIKAVVFGHAVADALGVPVEFCDRSEVEFGKNREWRKREC